MYLLLFFVNCAILVTFSEISTSVQIPGAPHELHANIWLSKWAPIYSITLSLLARRAHDAQPSWQPCHPFILLAATSCVVNSVQVSSSLFQWPNMSPFLLYWSFELQKSFQFSHWSRSVSFLMPFLAGRTHHIRRLNESYFGGRTFSAEALLPLWFYYSFHCVLWLLFELLSFYDKVICLPWAISCLIELALSS